MSEKLYKTYQEFWPYYLQEHLKPKTRMFHYIGTTFVILTFLMALFVGPLWLLLFMPLAGYSFAWVGHFFIEKNKPATFTYPLWSLISDFKMYFMWLSGKLDQEYSTYNIDK